MFKYFLAFYLIVLFTSCYQKETSTEKLPYASLNDSTAYVGIQTCRQCHQDKYETFIKTGMGMSFDRATKSKSSADFSMHALIFDSVNNFSYFPFWENDSFKVVEFRKAGKDTVFKRIETIDWIVGSGQHTNSHLMDVNGYVYQAPLTFYTQKKKWDLPPGFEGGYNSRFSRKIGLECMTCHNAFPGMELGSENKYNYIPNGIDCERCHGPGGRHVKEKQEGKIVDTSKLIDYSIVNPAKLPINLQLDICQRCHIQGNAVLEEGKSFFDFRPGMKLSDVMNIYMPQFTGEDDAHIMASHAERMKMSKCFLESEKLALEINKNHPTLTPYKNAMTCVTCHDPHVSVKATDEAVFNAKCKSCHNSQVGSGQLSTSKPVCKESVIKRKEKEDNCIKCHMPKSGSIDIPHVSTTDHWIRIPMKKDEIQKIKEFSGLICINNSAAGNRSKGEAFLSYFEKFSNNVAFLDSAKKYIDDGSQDNIVKNFHLLIRWAFLKNDLKKVIEYVNIYNEPIKALNKKSYTNDHAWTAYRIGDSYYALGDNEKAIEYFSKAIELAPYQPDFRNKLAGAFLDAGMIAEARNNYEFIIKENPEFASAYVSLGFLVLTKEGNSRLAEYYYDKALALDPDNIQALLNKAGLKLFQGKREEAKTFLNEVIRKDNNNEQAKYLLKNITKK
jgi:hypothetical protein